jgi:hypothetical protein
MVISTRLTRALDIRHPIMLAPMDLVADARLALAVSRAGGFGMIGGGYGEEAWVTAQLDGIGAERIGVGFITWSLAKNPRLLDLVLERRPPAVMLSFGEVRPFAEKIKKIDALLVCQIQTLAQARDALENGADILVAQPHIPSLSGGQPLSRRRPHSVGVRGARIVPETRDWQNGVYGGENGAGSLTSIFQSPEFAGRRGRERFAFRADRFAFGLTNWRRRRTADCSWTSVRIVGSGEPELLFLLAQTIGRPRTSRVMVRSAGAQPSAIASMMRGDR